MAIVKENLKFYKDNIQIPIAGEYFTYIFTAGKTVTLTLQSNRKNGLEIRDGYIYIYSLWILKDIYKFYRGANLINLIRNPHTVF
jgi:hypothetical protein